MLCSWAHGKIREAWTMRARVQQICSSKELRGTYQRKLLSLRTVFTYCLYLLSLLTVFCFLCTLCCTVFCSFEDQPRKGKRHRARCLFWAFSVPFAVQYCFALHCCTPECTVLPCTALYCTVLYCADFYCNVFYCTVVCSCVPS